jgi:molecular chaperone GrpE
MADILKKDNRFIMKNWFKKKNMDTKDTLQNEDILQDEAIEQAESTEDIAESNPINKDMEALQAQVSDLKNKLLYQQAEFDNYRKRMMKEKADIIALASRDTLAAIIPVLDDFDRASKNEQFTEGVNLIWQKMLSTVKSKGLSEMDSPQGTDFDPDMHEAITEVPMGDDMKGKVVDTVEKGYLLNDKIIRFAKVVVGN